MNVIDKDLLAPAPGAEAEDWYKDAVIYQIHVKAYMDSNGDGIGDFAGLMSRLDHVQDLGGHGGLAAALLPVSATRRRL